MLNVFYEKIEDAEYGTYYLPSTLGFTAIAVIMILLLILAVYFTSNKGRKMKTRDIAFCSLAMALAYVSSTFFKIFKMPMGGSVTLFSMLFITLIGYWYGLRTGLTAAIAYGMLQLVTDPWIISIPQVLFDYIFAFGALGLSGFFSKSKYGLVKGYISGVFGRLLFSYLSGIIFFASNAADWNMSVPLYSLAYNGAYIGTEAAITLVLLLIPPVNKALAQVKKLALNEQLN